jgi:superfamily II RNA helicase
MHPETVMTDTEREQLAQIADMKAAKSRGQSAATITLRTIITLLTKELTSTREALKDANTAQMLLSKELDRAREQIAELEWHRETRHQGRE